MSSRSITRLVSLAALAGLAFAGVAQAQTWPAKPVRMVVNFAPGGAADVIGRALAPVLGQALKQTVIVDNKPGASGNIGAAEVAKAPADGYTFLLSSGSTISINPLLYSNMPFDPAKDLVPVAPVARVHVFLETHPSVPVNNIAEFLAYLKANPGKLSFGSPGQGSSPHLSGEMLKTMAKVDAVHVPYKGAGPALTDILSGQLQFWFDPGPGLKHVQDGKLKMLAIGSAKRSPQFPNVPTLAESGLPGFDTDTVFGLYAPAGTPPAVVKRVHEEVAKALQGGPLVDVIKGLGASPELMSLPAYADYNVNEKARFAPLVKAAGLKVE